MRNCTIPSSATTTLLGVSSKRATSADCPGTGLWTRLSLTVTTTHEGEQKASKGRQGRSDRTQTFDDQRQKLRANAKQSMG